MSDWDLKLDMVLMSDWDLKLDMVLMSDWDLNLTDWDLKLDTVLMVFRVSQQATTKQSVHLLCALSAEHEASCGL